MRCSRSQRHERERSRNSKRDDRNIYAASMRAVDTNVLVRLVTGDDAAQAAAAEEFVSSGAWVSHLVLAETLWVLATVYERDAKALAQTVELLLKSQDLTFQDAEVVVAALKHYRGKPSLGFSDCLVLEIARIAGHLPLGSFVRVLSNLECAQLIISCFLGLCRYVSLSCSCVQHIRVLAFVVSDSPCGCVSSSS